MSAKDSCSDRDFAELVRRSRLHDELVAVCRAAIAYDKAIASCGNEPGKMTSFCTAEGDDLDALYADWMDKARAALAKAETP